jgi:hypothetical protein
MVQATQSGRGHSGSTFPGSPGERGNDGGAGRAAEAEIAALATRLIPLRNSDEPMTVNGGDPGGMGVTTEPALCSVRELGTLLRSGEVLDELARPPGAPVALEAATGWAAQHPHASIPLAQAMR